jgi:chaperone modulatory protein CbpM
MERREFLARARLEEWSLDVFVAEGWLMPGAANSFSDIDVARAQFIRELQQDLGVNDEGVPIILDLVDQICGLRRALAATLARVRTHKQGSDG